MAKRDYSDLVVPYEVSWWKLQFAMGQVQEHWHLLPENLAHKVNQAYQNREQLVITKADLDSLSDEAWAALVKKINPPL